MIRQQILPLLLQDSLDSLNLLQDSTSAGSSNNISSLYTGLKAEDLLDVLLKLG